MFSSRAEGLLRRAGWFPGRRVDVGNYRSVLSEGGYAASEWALNLLSEFGGLTVQVYSDPGVTFQSFTVDVSARFIELDPINMAFDRRVLGGPFDLVGYLHRFEYDVLVRDNGCTYVQSSNMYWQIGDDPRSAVESLCTGGRWSKVEYS